MNEGEAVKWKKGRRHEKIIALLNERCSLTSEGQLSWSTDKNVEVLLDALVSSIKEPQLSEDFQFKAVKRTLAQGLDGSVSQFERRYSESILFLEGQSQKYLCVFRVYDLQNIASGIHKWEGVTLDFSASVSGRLQKALDERRPVISTGDLYERRWTFDSRRCTYVTCVTQAISASDAYERSYDALSLWLGLANFWLKAGLVWQFRSGPYVPINEILIVPGSTVHYYNGEIAYQGFWYDDWFMPRDSPTRLTDDKLERLRDKLCDSIVGLRESKWQDFACRVVREHFHAFSQWNPTDAILRGWRVLEILAGDEQTPYDTLVRRASRMFRDEEEMFVIANYLKNRRNDLSHSQGAHAEHDDLAAFQLKLLLLPLVRFVIFNPYNFSDVHEMRQFLDLPSDKQKRDRLIYLLEKADKHYS